MKAETGNIKTKSLSKAGDAGDKGDWKYSNKNKNKKKGLKRYMETFYLITQLKM